MPIHKPRKRAGGLRSHRRRLPADRHSSPAGQTGRLSAMRISMNIQGPVFVSEQPPVPTSSLIGGVPPIQSHVRKSVSLRDTFREHADLWRKETRHWSSVTKMTIHPSYRRIMGMGPAVLPLLLQELRERPDHWFVALNAITGDDPTPPSGTFHEAVDAWILWGIQHGYL